MEGSRTSGSRLLASGSLKWCLLGLVVAIGVLAKHNMALFVPSLGLFLLLSPAHRRELLRPGFWLMALVGGVIGGGPILWWNAQHDWVTFLHVGTQATGASAGGGIQWTGPLEFLGAQTALLMGGWMLLLCIGICHVAAGCFRRNVEPQQLFLACLAAPMLLVCLLFSFKVRIEPNWPITAYITGLALAGWMLLERWHIRYWRIGAIAVMIAGLGLSLLVHCTWLLYPLHQRWLPDVSVRRWDPSCRLKGWNDLAAAVNAMRKELPGDPLLLASTWNLTGSLAFHLPDQPTVYCLGPVTGNRHSQYDFWRPNPLHDPAEFAGRDAVIVGELSPQVIAAFETIEPSRRVQAVQHGLVVAEWKVTVARGLKREGFGMQVQKY